PLAQALDILQSENNIFLGHLLPTISSLILHLKRIKEQSNKCRPLAEALLRGIHHRFDSYFESREMFVATSYLPEFKIRLFNSEQREKARKYLLEEVTSMDDGLDSPEIESSKGNSSFFCSEPSSEDTPDDEVNRFLAD
ncbi:Uncharacterized protein FKW44_000551, partial [Caligus rogercresseyi]